MANSEKETSWERIQTGVNEAEKLITRQDYSSSMIKCQQTLEYMVKQLAARAYIPDGGDLEVTIDALYKNGWISKTTCEHYHTIHMIGSKAVHEGYSNAYDANQAHHMLSQEVYTFSHDYGSAPKGTRTKRPANASSSRPSPTPDNRKRLPESKIYSIETSTLLKLMVPILSVILLLCTAKLFKPSSRPEKQPPAAMAESMTMPPATSASQAKYKTTTVLNIRSGPSTESEILGKLNAGDPIDYIRRHDDDWVVIRYKNTEAYVASQYITKE